jgi:hypothetical protein
MRNAARLKMGYYPLPESEGAKLRSLLAYTQPASAVDPWTNELRLVYADGRTLKLTEIPAKKEEEADGECPPEARAA